MKPILVRTTLREVTMELRWVPMATENTAPDSYDPRNTRVNAPDFGSEAWKLQQKRVMTDYWRAGKKKGVKPKNVASQILYVIGGPGDDIEYVYATERSEWFDIPAILYFK